MQISSLSTMLSIVPASMDGPSRPSSAVPALCVPELGRAGGGPLLWLRDTDRHERGIPAPRIEGIPPSVSQGPIRVLSGICRDLDRGLAGIGRSINGALASISWSIDRALTGIDRSVNRALTGIDRNVKGSLARIHRASIRISWSINGALASVSRALTGIGQALVRILAGGIPMFMGRGSRDLGCDGHSQEGYDKEGFLCLDHMHTTLCSCELF